MEDSKKQIKEEEANHDGLGIFDYVPKKMKEWTKRIMKMVKENETYTQYGDRQIKKKGK